MKKALKFIIGAIVAIIVIVAIVETTKDKGDKKEATTMEQTADKKEQKEEKKEEKKDYELKDVAVESDEVAHYVTGVLVNNTDSKKSYVQVEFPVYDKDGNKLGTALDNVNNLEPGKSWKFKAIYLGTEKEIDIHTDEPDITGF
ncbi:MAG: FxLYD domain-containing protein [Eubacteriales bacterium]|nr:FxLYD domain-containing protein [Eubacteriales bacterium]